jgi:alkaline phosphatase/alkaline phosphatase D
MVIRRADRHVTTFLAFIILLSLLHGCAADPGPRWQRMRDRTDGQASHPVREPTMHWQGEMAGEVTTDSVILRARLATKAAAALGDVPGRPGVAAFALSEDPAFSDATLTDWVEAVREDDYIVRQTVGGLAPGTRYYYRLLSGPDQTSAQAGPTGTFRTLDERGVARETRLVAVTSMHRYSFRATALRDFRFRQRVLGFPSLEAILAREPDFFVSTGDSVYYDCPAWGRARTAPAMRAKWHKQFATPRFRALFQAVPTYWMKDDHDYRYDDADPHGTLEPLPELGAEVFLEQVPVVDPSAESPLTYRTHRINDLLQIWLLEGRDYRDPNTADPGPDKTMWGDEQKAWLKQTLLDSDAAFKVIISPTPMVGPDDAWTGKQGGLLAPLFGGNPVGQGGDRRKRDNHTNPSGFREEAEAFFDWLVDEGFDDAGLFFVCGDRHWQYHSVHPSGFEEFSAGALVDGSSRLGPRPGDAGSTDPEGLIDQPYQQEKPGGGFLEVAVYPAAGDGSPTIAFTFYDKEGAELYRAERAGR